MRKGDVVVCNDEKYVEDVHTEEYEVGFDVNLSGEKVTWEDFYDKVQKTAEKYKVTLKIEYTSEYSDRVWESVAFVGPDSHKLYQEYVYQKLEEYMTTTFLINADYLAHEGYKDKVISLLDRVNAQMEKYK